MELRALGTTGIRVSAIGLGTVRLGRAEGLKYPGPVRVASDEEARAVLEEARSLGVNLIDTAPAYGNAEERIGALLPGRREEWVLCTKAGEEFTGGESRFDFSPEAVAASVRRSLERLRTEYLDIVLLHSDGRAEGSFASMGSFDVLREMKARGQVRAFGASTKTVAGALEAIEHADVVMVTLNRRSRADESALPEAVRRGVGVLVKKALASGHLGADPAQGVREALAWVLTRPGVSSVVIGTADPSHLRYDVEAAREVLAGL